jgi:hypothetical protein
VDVFGRNHQIVLANKSEETLLLGPSASKLLNLASEAVPAQVILASIATGWALGVSLEQLVQSVSEYAAEFGASQLINKITNQSPKLRSAAAN